MNTIRDALLSQAVADAVGNPFEFGDPNPFDVQAYMKGRISHKPLWITDDTQMTMFGIEGIKQGDVFAAYDRWYSTQRAIYPVIGATGLQAEELMFRVEAPGNTCLSSLHARRHGRTPEFESKGCGAVMRTLPFVLYKAQFGSWNRAFEAARYAGKWTHTHHESDGAVLNYMHYAHERLNGKVSATTQAIAGYKEITDHGEGWTALSCIRMAIWAVENAKNYDDLLIKSICHPGDSDSVAAVAGGLWGLTEKGYEKYLPRLQHLQVIDKLLGENGWKTNL